MNSKQSGRRRFLKGGAALVGGLAVGGMGPASGQELRETDLVMSGTARPRGQRSPYVKSVRRGLAGQGVNALTPLQDTMGIITPSELHFEVNHENGALPILDPEKHRLLVHGLVERPLVLTMAELKRLPSVSRVYFLECNGNGSAIFSKDSKTPQDTHGRTSCSEWTGVPLSLVLKEAGVKEGAKWLVMQSADPSRHAHSVPIFKALDDALLAYGQNGEPLRLEQGYPLRLVMPGWGGRILVKWLTRIEVVDQPYMPRQEIFLHMDHSPVGPGTWMITGEKAITYQFRMFPKSIITFPSGEQRLPGPGFYEVSGLAWSGGGAIRRVEISTDGGRTYKDAPLQDPVLRFAHTRFRFPWTWNGEEALLQSRCTDEQGDVQPSPEQVREIWGSDTSDACRSVLGDLCNRIPRRTVNAVITTWKVNRDGRVENAMPSKLLAMGPQTLESLGLGGLGSDGHH